MFTSPNLPALFNNPPPGGGAIVTTKDGVGAVLKVGTQTIKFGAGLGASIIGGEVVVVSTGAPIVALANSAAYFNNAGVLTGDAAIGYDSQRFYLSIPRQASLAPVANFKHNIFLGPTTVTGNLIQGCLVVSRGAPATPNNLSNFVSLMYDLLVVGENNTIRGSSQSIIVGTLNNTQNGPVWIFGANNNIKGINTAVFGISNTDNTGLAGGNTYNFIFGLANTVAPNSSFNAIFGQDNIANSNGGNFLFGVSNQSNLGANYSGCVGRDLRLTAAYSFHCGTYNAPALLLPDPLYDLIFTVGIGSGAGRMNAIEVCFNDGATRTIKEVMKYSLTNNLVAGFTIHTTGNTHHTYQRMNGSASAVSDSVTAIAPGDHDGQLLTLYNPTGWTFTIKNNANTRLEGKVDFVMAPNDVLTLVWNRVLPAWIMLYGTHN
jgi:hypothetical protein